MKHKHTNKCCNMGRIGWCGHWIQGTTLMFMNLDKMKIRCRVLGIRGMCRKLPSKQLHKLAVYCIQLIKYRGNYDWKNGKYIKKNRAALRKDGGK